jgi:sterol desaturase/sphingolipid hydroxylase (fatty acid hydroxylase superfamily)
LNKGDINFEPPCALLTLAIQFFAMTTSFFYTSIALLVVFFLVEFFVDQKEQKELYKSKDTATSIIIGAGLLISSFIARLIMFSFFYFLYSISIFKFSETWITWTMVILLCDFSFYWYHRAAHTVNFFWASHSVHHSSEQFNISVAFRQSWMTQFTGQFLFWSWLVLLGFHPLMVFMGFQIGQFYQTWLHTELIKKLHPAFEWLFNTPSHHRVHHAKELEYLDKNYGGILIIWDRLFGTFQEEVEKPSYGLTTKRKSDNLSIVMWSDWKMLWCNIRSAGSFKNAVNYIIQPPGWSHAGNSKTVKELRKVKTELKHEVLYLNKNLYCTSFTEKGLSENCSNNKKKYYHLSPQ